MNLADELVSKEEIAAELLDYGLSPEVVAAAVQAPVSQVRLLSPKSRAFSPAADAVLVDEVRTLARLCVVEAQKMVMFGPTTQKQTIIRSMLSLIGRSLAADSNESADVMRERLEVLFSEARTVPTTITLVTDEGIEDVEAEALPQTTLYQDQIFGDEEP